MTGSAPTDLRALLRRARVVPVLTVDDDQDAVALAKALFDGGLWMLEVTLRTRGALGAVRRIAAALPAAVVGVGTVTRPEEFAAAAEAQARFAVSPGLTPTLAAAGHRTTIPYLPAAAPPPRSWPRAGRLHRPQVLSGWAGGTQGAARLLAPFPTSRSA
jgi:2-dehydro-3-deoxyphosphogluconate aldolase/(4S)-4-hydroxy-2-oxoglutarate aldolase